MENLGDIAEICLDAAKINITGGDFPLWCLDEEIEEGGLAARFPHHEETTAEKGSKRRFGDTGRQRPGDHRIHRCPPGAENLRSRLGGQTMPGGDSETHVLGFLK